MIPVRVALVALAQILAVFLFITAATLAFGVPGLLGSLAMAIYKAADEFAAFAPEEPEDGDDDTPIGVQGG